MYSTVAVLIAESCDVLYTQALKDKRDAAACRACTSSTPTTCRACILHKHQDQCEKRHKVIKPCGAQGVLLGSSMQQLQRRFSGPLTCHKQSVMTCQLTRQHLASRRARSVPTLPVREQRERWHRERYTACQGLRSRAAAAAAELARPPHTQVGRGERHQFTGVHSATHRTLLGQPSQFGVPCEITKLLHSTWQNGRHDVRKGWKHVPTLAVRPVYLQPVQPLQVGNCRSTHRPFLLFACFFLSPHRTPRSSSTLCAPPSRPPASRSYPPWAVRAAGSTTWSATSPGAHQAASEPCNCADLGWQQPAAYCPINTCTLACTELRTRVRSAAAVTPTRAIRLISSGFLALRLSHTPLWRT